MKLFPSKAASAAKPPTEPLSSTQLARVPEAPGEEGSAPPQPSRPPEPPEIEPRLARRPQLSWRSARWGAWWSGGAWRLEATALLVALLIGLALSPQVLNFATRDDYDRALQPFSPGWQTLEALEGRLLDARFSSRGKVVPQSASSIAIVGIDQRSLDDLDQWPWPRSWHARLIQRLKAAGARSIVFDVNFSAKQGSAAQGGLSRDDQALVAASEAAGNVLIASGYRERPKAIARGKALLSNEGSPFEITPPFEELDSTTSDIGFNYQPRNSSGEARSYAWRARVSGAPVASLSALAVGMLQGKLDGNENKSFFQVLEGNRWPDARGHEHQLPLWETAVGRDDRVWSTPIFFWGPEGTFATYSYEDVLAGKGAEWTPAGLKQKFGGRIVFVGGMAGSLNDVFNAPAFPGEHSAVVSQLPGVELHASMAAQMLDGRYIHAQSTQSALATLLGMCVCGALWMGLLRERISRAARRAQSFWSKRRWPGHIHSAVWLSLYAALGGLPAWIFWSVAQWRFSHLDEWIVAVYPLIGVTLSSISALLLFFGVESSERRKVHALFSRHVSPDVADELLSSPEGDAGRPRHADVSVLFSDLEGFTYFSKTHAVEEVVEALNEYMTRMVEVVLAHGGSVDKFIGDAVMAFFGAPVARYDHAAQALACAVAMQDECARFRRETGVQFFMRVGVHSGQAIVGEMGSQNQVSYTVIGDTVNLAARLEAKNKELSARILCSDDTYKRAAGVVEAIPSHVSIKGLDDEVGIWIVRGLTGAISEDSWRPLPLRSHEDAPAEEPGPDEPPLLALPPGAQDAQDAARQS